MSTVASLITGARSVVNDAKGDNFEREDFTVWVDGTRTRFDLAARNLIDINNDGAPKDPAIYRAGVAVASPIFDKTIGVVTITPAPTLTSGADFKAEYYFLLLTDAEYLGYAKDAAKFVDAAGDYTAVTDAIGFVEGLTPAVEHYMAHHAATKLANQTAWWFNTSLGNKTISKTDIYSKWRQMAEDEYKQAKELRDDYYQNRGKRYRPAYGMIRPNNIVNPTPRR